MISQLASPSVCVIDDEEEEYRPILDALNGLYVSCVHILGNDIEKLPPHPFARLRLVFVDLHLSGTVGKAAASHTANVFLKVVAPETAPIVVVIWSKYAQDLVAEAGVPLDDQETEAGLFKRTLLEAEPKYQGRLIFLELEKPKKDARPSDWAEELKGEINRVLSDQSAVEVLWTWDSLVKDASAAVSEGLTTFAAKSATQQGAELKDKLRETMQRLAKAQGENDLTAATAPGHLVTVLGELLSDQLEHPGGLAGLSAHGTWLSQDPATAATNDFAQLMNGFLLTAPISDGAAPFVPGTLYRIENTDQFLTAFGSESTSLIHLCFGRGPGSEKLAEWKNAAKPVALEISPICDFAQNNRVGALLIAGLILPDALMKDAKKGDSFTIFPEFRLRWPQQDFPEQNVFLIFCHRYKAVLPAATVPTWLRPWFRLRELPTASLRNLQAGHASRVGYVSVAG